VETISLIDCSVENQTYFRAFAISGFPSVILGFSNDFLPQCVLKEIVFDILKVKSVNFYICLGGIFNGKYEYVLIK